MQYIITRYCFSVSSRRDYSNNILGRVPRRELYKTSHEGHPNVLSIWPEYVEPYKLEGEEYKYHEMCDDRNHVTACFLKEHHT